MIDMNHDQRQCWDRSSRCWSWSSSSSTSAGAPSSSGTSWPSWACTSTPRRSTGSRLRQTCCPSSTRASTRSSTRSCRATSGSRLAGSAPGTTDKRCELWYSPCRMFKMTSFQTSSRYSVATWCNTIFFQFRMNTNICWIIFTFCHDFKSQQ